MQTKYRIVDTAKAAFVFTKFLEAGNAANSSLIVRNISRQSTIAAAPLGNILLCSDAFDGGIYQLPINKIK